MAWHSRSVFQKAWPPIWRNQKYDTQSSSEDATLLPTDEDSILKVTSSSTWYWMVTLTVINIVFLALNIALVFIASSKRTSSTFDILQSKPKLNAALKELSSYCQSTTGN
jgi:hypothetical protein